MAKSDDLIKYITQRVVTYMDTPKEVRKIERSSSPREQWSSRWFGMIPLSINLWFGERKKKRTPKSN